MLTPHHYAVIANWIDKESDSHYKIHNNPYKFKLLYSHHIDNSMNLPILHSVLSKTATLIVGRTKNSDQLIGGYNPIGFNRRNLYRFSRNSFIFIFKDDDDFKSGKCGYVSQPESAVYCNESFELAFGKGPDLLCKNDGTWTSNPFSYPSIGIPRSSEILHYEVFRIIEEDGETDIE